MSKTDSLPMFERDPNQNGSPPGHTAYILRHWGAVYEGGTVTRVEVYEDRPSFMFRGEAGSRLARYPDEVSRLFVRDDAEIDPEVFRIKAGPVPSEMPTNPFKMTK